MYLVVLAQFCVTEMHIGWHIAYAYNNTEISLDDFITIL